MYFFLVTIILQERIAATYKITIPLNRSWKQLLSANTSQLFNTYKPGNTGIRTFRYFFLKNDGSHSSETGHKYLPSIGLQSVLATFLLNFVFSL